MTQTAAYRVYMRSPLWRLRRRLWYLASDRRCERCGVELVLHHWQTFRLPGSAGPRVLTVHHVSYRRLGRERRADVELLCWSCHCRRDGWRR